MRPRVAQTAGGLEARYKIDVPAWFRRKAGYKKGSKLSYIIRGFPIGPIHGGKVLENMCVVVQARTPLIPVLTDQPNFPGTAAI